MCEPLLKEAGEKARALSQELADQADTVGGAGHDPRPLKLAADSAGRLATLLATPPAPPLATPLATPPAHRLTSQPTSTPLIKQQGIDMTAFEPEATEPKSDSTMSDAPDRDELDQLDDSDDVEVVPPGPYAARAASYFRNVRYGVVLLLIVFGGWFLYDGFVAWPAERAKYLELQAEIEQANARGDSTRAAELVEEQKDYNARDGWDIPSNRVLGFALPPLGLLLLAYWLRISRGEVRLDETDVLHVPGHPAVRADEVTEIDDELWDRKGIAYLKYETAGGPKGTIKLDDFVYERGPVDKIHDRLVYLLDQRAV